MNLSSVELSGSNFTSTSCSHLSLWKRGTGQPWPLTSGHRLHREGAWEPSTEQRHTHTCIQRHAPQTGSYTHRWEIKRAQKMHEFIVSLCRTDRKLLQFTKFYSFSASANKRLGVGLQQQKHINLSLKSEQGQWSNLQGWCHGPPMLQLLNCSSCRRTAEA